MLASCFGDELFGTSVARKVFQYGAKQLNWERAQPTADFFSKKVVLFLWCSFFLLFLEQVATKSLNNKRSNIPAREGGVGGPFRSSFSYRLKPFSYKKIENHLIDQNTPVVRN